MRFLADAGISPKTVEFLKQLGHEATHVRELGMQRVESVRYRIRNLPILR
jgi:predicted nuclease of predicted toxin-antitoxin system